jgi:hypothetical protein
MEHARGPVGERVLAGLVAPSGLIRAGEISQGKPWAMLFWPLRATDWKRPNFLIFAPFNPGLSLIRPSEEGPYILPGKTPRPSLPGLAPTTDWNRHWENNFIFPRIWHCIGLQVPISTIFTICVIILRLKQARFLYDSI